MGESGEEEGGRKKKEKEGRKEKGTGQGQRKEMERKRKGGRGSREGSLMIRQALVITDFCLGADRLLIQTINQFLRLFYKSLPQRKQKERN